MAAQTPDIRDRIDHLPWPDLQAQLDECGYAITPVVLTGDECDELAGLFASGHFRSTIDMARHRFGDGRYRYFDHPLPDDDHGAAPGVLRPSGLDRQPVGRTAAWRQRRLPCGSTKQLLERCRDAGQTRPTPLILRYGPGEWNALHQDLYGDVFFPLQAVTVLSPSGGRLRRRRVRPGGTAAARAEPGARP